MNKDRPRAWRLSAPTDGQLALLARYGIDPPDGATRGEVSDMLDFAAEYGSTSWHPRDFERDDVCDVCGQVDDYCDCDEDDSNYGGDDEAPPVKAGAAAGAAEANETRGTDTPGDDKDPPSSSSSGAQ